MRKKGVLKDYWMEVLTLIVRNVITSKYTCVRSICIFLHDMKSKRDERPTMKVLVLVCVSEGNMGKL